MHMSAIVLPLRRTQSVSISADMLTLRREGGCKAAALRSGKDIIKAIMILAAAVEASIS